MIVDKFRYPLHVLGSYCPFLDSDFRLPCYFNETSVYVYNLILGQFARGKVFVSCSFVKRNVILLIQLPQVMNHDIPLRSLTASLGGSAAGETTKKLVGGPPTGPT